MLNKSGICCLQTCSWGWWCKYTHFVQLYYDMFISVIGIADTPVSRRISVSKAVCFNALCLTKSSCNQHFDEKSKLLGMNNGFKIWNGILFPLSRSLYWNVWHDICLYRFSAASSIQHGEIGAFIRPYILPPWIAGQSAWGEGKHHGCKNNARIAGYPHQSRGIFP